MSASNSPHRLRALLWAVAVVGVVALVAWRATAWNAPAASSQAGDGAAAVKYDDTPGVELYGPDERVKAPALEGTTLDGDFFALSDLTGHVVVINVWGSWCSPCRAEAPDLARLARETAGQGVRFVGIDTRDTLAAAKAFVRSFDIPYPSVVDDDGQVLLGFDGLVPLTAVPSTLVIDRHGNIAARVIGAVTYTTLKGLISDELTVNTRASSTTTSSGSGS